MAKKRKPSRKKDGVVQVSLRFPIAAKDWAFIQASHMKVRRAEKIAFETPTVKYLVEMVNRHQAPRILPGDEWMYKSYDAPVPDMEITVKALVEKAIAPIVDPWLAAYQKATEVYACVLREILGKYHIPIGSDFAFDPTGMISVTFPCPEEKRGEIVGEIMKASMIALVESLETTIDGMKKHP